MLISFKQEFFPHNVAIFLSFIVCYAQRDIPFHRCCHHKQTHNKVLEYYRFSIKTSSGLMGTLRLSYIIVVSRKCFF